jgi:Ca2+-binding RTX toxin-like protein
MATTIPGTDGADSLTGTDLDEVIYGYLPASPATDTGADTLSGAGGADTVYGGGGADTVSGDAGDDQVSGDAGNDTLRGGDGRDFLYGGDDLDLIGGGAGDDYALGGAGDDTIYGETGHDYLDGSDGADLLVGGAGDDTLGGGADALVDTLAGGDGIDDWRLETFGTLAYTFALNETPGAASLLRYDGVIVAVGRSMEAISFELGSGADSVTGGRLQDQVWGGAGNDTLAGLGGRDRLDGQEGVDSLSGGAGDDQVSGGSGPNPMVAVGLTDVLDGGAGSDLWEVQWSSAEGVRLIWKNGADAVTTLFSDGVATQTAVRFEHLNFSGYDGADSVVAGGGHDQLSGGKGADTLIGGAGDDAIIGDYYGDGVDSFDGGAGDDVWAQYGHVGPGALSFTLDDRPGATSVMIANGAIIAAGRNFERVYLYGGAGADRFVGGNGEDTLDGGDGDDRLNGGGGDDYVQDYYGDNTIQGGAGDDYLSGGGGSELIRGGDGADTLDGGRAPTGVDTLDGGDGADGWQVSGRGAEALSVTLNTDPNAASTAASNGAVIATATHMELLYADGAQGNDSLVGAGGADQLYGGEGGDTLKGGGGNDYIGGGFTLSAGGVDPAARDSLDGGAGSDVWSVEGYSLLAPLVLTLRAPNVVSKLGVGGVVAQTAINMDRLDVVGGVGADRFVGGAGADTLDGYFGRDTLNGGGGSDILAFYSFRQGVTASLATGTTSDGDVLISIENLIGTYYDDTLIGDDRANRIDGRGGFDSIEGGGGDDVLRGAYEADVLRGGDGADTATYFNRVIENTYEEAAISVSLATGTGRGGEAQGDRLFSIENLIGTIVDDALTGNGGANVLQGAAGADTLDGGGGRDTADYSLSDEGVTVSLAQGKGTAGDAKGDALSSIEDLAGSAFGDVLAGDAVANRLTGRGGADLLYGRAQRDALDGGAGADTLVGGEAADTLTGGAGADVFRFDNALVAGQADRIVDFDTRLDHVELARGVFRGLTVASLEDFAYVGAIGRDGSGRLFYDDRSGVLSFDADRGGPGKAIAIAVLTGSPHLTADDFALV